MKDIKVKSEECKDCLCPHCKHLATCPDRKEHAYDIFVRCDGFKKKKIKRKPFTWPYGSFLDL
jgi:hypothetical protein